MTKGIIEVLNQKKNISSSPIWLMRQAGRYLPEYKLIRKSKKGFLDLCYDPVKASEVTLQPLKRFNLDAAIIFSDILVIPDSMGIKVVFEENSGPILDKISKINELEKLEPNQTNLNKVYEAISITKKNLPKNRALIGFSGSPWTLSAYIVEGKLTKDLSIIKNTYYNNPDFINTLIEKLTTNIISHLIKQIEAGAEIIQLFDSWAGLLTGKDYQDLVIEPNKKIVEIIKNRFPQIPIICFPRMSGLNYRYFCEQVECNAISIDQYIDIKWIKEIKNNKVIQGNLDPTLLLANSTDILKQKIDYIFNIMNDENFIFNLGHGVLPQAKIENVEFIVNYVKNYAKQ